MWGSEGALDLWPWKHGFFLSNLFFVMKHISVTVHTNCEIYNYSVHEFNVLVCSLGEGIKEFTENTKKLLMALHMVRKCINCEQNFFCRRLATK